jgi:hypothetical protein
MVFFGLEAGMTFNICIVIERKIFYESTKTRCCWFFLLTDSPCVVKSPREIKVRIYGICKVSGFILDVKLTQSMERIYG